MMNGKIVILGAGHVGSHVARALASGGIGQEIVLVDLIREKAEAQAMDIADSLSFPAVPMVVRTGTAAECADADVTVVAIGKAREPGQTRLDLLGDSTRMIYGLAQEMKESGVGGPVVSITNPCDIMADCLRKLLGLSRFRVFGTGTLLDTARLLRTLGEQTGCARDRIEACVLGEHGDSSMIPFSAVRIGGKKPGETAGFDAEHALRRTHEIGMDIINGKGSTEFGIGQAAAFLIRSILLDTKAVLPLSVHLEGEYGLTDVQCGVPCAVGKNGIERIVELPMTAEEREALGRSAEIICKHTRLADEIIAGLE
ncbi:MAG: L-lactate dehydrogenase [Clostridia bacterium]|nr:L-lactate dehydrogenase [Clostridia bacterium]